MKPALSLIAFGLILTAAACGQSVSRPAIDESELIDLTYSFDANTPYWPTAKPFHFQRDAWGVSPGGYWYAAGSYSASEHGGTHLDSPIHFAKDGAAVDQIRLRQLIGAAVVIDVTPAAAQNRDYLVTAQDLAAWEKAHGPVPAGSIAIVRTGWGRHWPDKKQYLGSDKPGDASDLHFPGIGREAAEALLARKVKGVGIDTASIDFGPSKDFIAHRILNGAGIYMLENVAQVEKLPATGATLIALPMKIAGGSGAPVRIIAILQ
jgi:kynurenine formamidase